MTGGTHIQREEAAVAGRRWSVDRTRNGLRRGLSVSERASPAAERCRIGHSGFAAGSGVLWKKVSKDGG